MYPHIHKTPLSTFVYIEIQHGSESRSTVALMLKSLNTINWTPRAGPYSALLPLYDSLKMDISLRQTLFSDPRGVHLRELTT